MEFEDIRRKVGIKFLTGLYSRVLATNFYLLPSTLAKLTKSSINFSSHPELTQLVARKAGVKVGDVVLEKFANNETSCEIKEHVRVNCIFH